MMRGDRHTARVTVHADADAVRARVPGGGGTVTPLDDGRCELRTGDDDLDWLSVRILMLGAEVEVHEPPELRERLRALSDRMRRAAGPSGEHS
jgi:predicted DNA-binding transcriptional regulator YafY